MPQARLHALQRLLAGFIADPVPGVLVVACTDLEVFYLTHTLDALDQESPADRYWIVADPFTGPRAYVDILEASVLAELGPAFQTNPADPPLARFEQLLAQLLATLPAGDHHLVCALVPAQIDDAEGFAGFTAALLHPPADPRLRIVLRDDHRDPHPFETAAASPSEQVVAYHFSLPPELVLASTAAAAGDPRLPPAARAQAILQLASRDIGHGDLRSALARCDAVAALPVPPELQAFALALRADALRHGGDTEAALAAGSAALQAAVAAGARPVVHHAAMALGDLTEALGARKDALACFTLAERATPMNPALQDRARARLDALRELP